MNTHTDDTLVFIKTFVRTYMRAGTQESFFRIYLYYLYVYGLLIS